MDDILHINNLSKSYISGNESLNIFNNFNLSLKSGETLAITGESGSGKSTLLNLIAGLDGFDSGAINCGGYNIGVLDEKGLASYRNKELGFIFQFHFLLNDFNVIENIAIPALIAGERFEVAEIKALEMLKKVNLKEKQKNFPLELSGGERQRVAIARALMNEPNIILADEPTGSLDDKNSKIVYDLLFNILKEYGKSMILVTHDKNLAQQCDRHIELSKAK